MQEFNSIDGIDSKSWVKSVFRPVKQVFRPGKLMIGQFLLSLLAL